MDQQSDKFITYYAEIPGLSFKRGDFEKHYEEIVSEWYIAEDRTPKKIYFGNIESPQRCCLCLKTEPEVSFNSESHTIPDFLGNEMYFSNDECDECNGNFGRLCEAELANMTEPARKIFEIPRRQVHGSVTKNDKDVSWNSLGHMEIRVGSEVRLKHIHSQNELTLEADAPKYRPARAVLSIIKTVWLLFDKEKRDKFPWLFEVIQGTDITTPFQLARINAPDTNSHLIQYKVFAKTSTRDDIPALIIEFTMGHSKILWAPPDKKSKKYQPFPIPPIRARAKSPMPSLSFIYPQSIDEVFEPKSEKYKFSYSSIDKSPTLTPTLAAQRRREQELVHIHIRSGDVSLKLENFYLGSRNEKSSGQQITLTKRFPLSISLIPTQPGKCSLEYDFKPSGFNPKNILEALQFIELLGKQPCSVKICGTMGQEKISFEPNEIPSVNYRPEEKIASNLLEIESFFKTSIKYPNVFPNEEELKILDHIHAVVTERVDTDATGTINSILANENVTIDELRTKSLTVTMSFDSSSQNLFGRKFILPPYSIEFTKFEVLGVAEVKDGYNLSCSFKGMNHKILVL